MQRLLCAVVLILLTLFPTSCVQNEVTWRTYHNEFYGYKVDYPSSFEADTEDLRLVGFKSSDMGLSVSVHCWWCDSGEDPEDSFDEYVSGHVAMVRDKCDFSAIVAENDTTHLGYMARDVSLVMQGDDDEDMSQTRMLYVLCGARIYQVYGFTYRDKYESRSEVIDRFLNSLQIDDDGGTYIHYELEEIMVRAQSSWLIMEANVSQLDASYDEVDTEEEVRGVTAGGGSYSLYDRLTPQVQGYPLLQAYDITRNGTVYLD